MSEDAVTDLTRGVYRRLYAGFTKGQRINKLSLQAEAWFWRVLATVDDFGNGEADPQLCRDATAGRRTTVTKGQVSRWLDEMVSANLIEFYWAKGDKYLHVLKFESWQPAGKNGRRFRRFPDPSESEGIQGNPNEVSASEISNENTNENQNNNDSLRSKSALVAEIFEYWKVELEHPKAQLTPERKKKIEERLKDSTVQEIKTAIRGCKASAFHMGREPGKPKVFDDIQLICRNRSKLESFIDIATNGHGSNQKNHSGPESHSGDFRFTPKSVIR